MIENFAEVDPAVEDSREVGETVARDGVSIVRYVAAKEDATCPVSGFDSEGNRIWHLEGVHLDSPADSRNIKRLWDSTDGGVRILDDEGQTHGLNPKTGETEQLAYTEQIGEKSLSFDHPVETRVDFGDMLVILLRLEPGTPPRNVFAFDSVGDELWTIEPASNPHGGQSVYTRLWNKDGQLQVKSFHGWKYRVDPTDGSISKLHRVK